MNSSPDIDNNVSGVANLGRVSDWGMGKDPFAPRPKAGRFKDPVLLPIDQL
jgi:hypothetical protein